LNSKKIDFLISISLVFILSLAFVLLLNLYFVSKFEFVQKEYFYFLIFLIVFGLIVFLLFSKNFIKTMFRSDEMLEKEIKNTLHELNIPVSTIKMNIQLLQKSIKDEKDLKRLQRVEKANENLLKLYENLEYKFKKQLDKVVFEEFSLSEALKVSIESFSDIKKDTKIDIFDEDLTLYCDYNGFLIVLNNLIENAIKYNNKNNPYIKIELNDGILSIFNSGKTIDTKNIILVFDRYFQENQENSGFGLGLAIVKEFCDKNRVNINIQSLNHGTKIDLNLKNIIIKNHK
jgi:two-component system, OmpR family, sensor kinase